MRRASIADICLKSCFNCCVLIFKENWVPRNYTDHSNNSISLTPTMCFYCSVMLFCTQRGGAVVCLAFDTGAARRKVGCVPCLAALPCCNIGFMVALLAENASVAANQNMFLPVNITSIKHPSTFFNQSTSPFSSTDYVWFVSWMFFQLLDPFYLSTTLFTAWPICEGAPADLTHLPCPPCVQMLAFSVPNAVFGSVKLIMVPSMYS